MAQPKAFGTNAESPFGNMERYREWTSSETAFASFVSTAGNMGKDDNTFINELHAQNWGQKSRFFGRICGDFAREADGGNHAGGIGFAAAGEIVGGAVVGRGADEGKAQSPINAVFKRDH